MTINKNVEPYYDDFDSSKQYYQIMFRPGFAVQARELTQLQSLIQNQIQQFGDNIFKDGAAVLNGQTFFENNLKSMKLENPVVGEISEMDEYEGQTIVGLTSGSHGFVKKSASATVSGDPNTLIFKHISGSGFVNGESITLLGSATVVGRIQSANAINNAMIFSIDEGVFYFGGKFIINTAQVAIVDKYTNVSTKSVGFFVDESFVTSDDDESLLDNAQNSPNFAAPGADRHYIDLVLTVAEVNNIPDNFFEIARVTNGEIVVNKQANIYSAIGNELARRTYDESGDYTVRPFPLLLKDQVNTARAQANIVSNVITSYTILNGGSNFKTAPTVTITGDGTGAEATAVIDTNPASETYGQVTSITVDNGGSGYTTATVEISGDPSQFTASLDPGKAYVKGFEFETINQTNISVDRARTTEQANGIDTTLSYGNFVYVTSMFNAFNTTTFDAVELHNVARASVTDGTTQIGTANVRFLKWVSGTVGNAAAIYKMSLFNIVMSGSNQFKDVESIVIRSGASVLSGANIDLLSKVGGSAGGDVFLSGADTPTLVFPMNNEFIKTIRDEGNLVQTDYTIQRTFTGVAFSGGTATITTANANERFFGGAGAYSDSIKDQYYHVVVTAVGTSAFAVGEVLRFSTGSRTITGGAVVVGSTHQVTLNANAAVAFTATIIATINENQVGEKTKALQGYTYKIISSPATVVGGKNSLDTSDINSMLAVYNTGTTDPTGEISVNSTTGEVTWGSVTTHNDVTANYILDNGQRDEFYDHGAVINVASPPLNTQYLVVVFDYFTHSGNGYLSVDSYSIAYEDIPVYTSPATGIRYNLRDSIDFRPRRQDGGTTFQNGALPDPDFTLNADYQYYLPRIDIIYATKDRQLLVKQGIPSLLPQVPTDESNSMLLYIMSIPAYTANLGDIAVKYIENKRYTMRDIGKIADRIDNIEYYTQLSLLEKQAQDESITDSSNLEKFKNGFLVDPFVGHSVGDMDDPDYRCSIDPTKRELRPFYEVYNSNFTFDEFTNTEQTGQLTHLAYTETTIIQQMLATRSLNINPFNVISFFGTLTLEPSEDLWVDTVQLPPINITIDQNQTIPDVYKGYHPWWGYWNTAVPWGWNYWGWAGYGYGYQNWGYWGGWIGGWWGWWWRPEVTVNQQVTTRSQSLGNNVVNTQFLPYIRANTIIGVGEGFKPKARLYPFMDEKNITQYTRPLVLVEIQNLTGTPFDDSNGVFEKLTFKTGGVSGTVTGTAKTALLSPPTSADPTKRLLSIFKQTINPVVGQTIVSASGANAVVTAVTTYSLGAVLMPDEFGLIAFEYQIPGQTFQCGERTIRLIDNIDNDTVSTESSAETKYFAIGQVQTKQETILTTRTVTTQRVICSRWYDPLAQSFLVDENVYPEGLHITSIEVYFRTKSSTVPVTMELRKMINGTPESIQSIPFGSVTLYPENVSVSEDNSAATKFTFPTPVQLVPGEYCFVLLANTQDYEVFVAEIGKTILNSNQIVTEQPYAGVLFKSQNASTWTAEQLQDMKFKINRAVFQTSGSVELVVNDPPFIEIEGDLTNSSANITNVVAENNYFGIAPGMLVVGTGVPANTVINSVDSVAGTIVMNNNATATAAGGVLRFYPIYEYSTLTMNSSVITPTNTNIVWSVKALNRDTNLMDAAYSNFDNMQDINLPAIKKIVPIDQNGDVGSLIIKAELSTTKDTVSPAVDIGRTSVVMIKNVINNDTTDETNNRGGNALARYITKQVTLKNGFDASNIVVTFDAYKPAGTSVAVYYKTLPLEKTTPIGEEDWVQMVAEESIPFSKNDNDYREHRFFPPGAFTSYNVPVNNPISPRFNNFKIKIVLLSSNEAIVPKIRDFRTIATDS